MRERLDPRAQRKRIRDATMPPFFPAPEQRTSYFNASSAPSDGVILTPKELPRQGVSLSLAVLLAEKYERTHQPSLKGSRV
jgi:hypothetical protein